jgi:membrane fusion protein (multidrug efflux system)
MAVLDTQELQLRTDVKAKQAMLDLAKINLGYTRITAPVGGEVSERDVRAGQYVHAGSQVITVVPLDNVWVVANYKETQLTHVAIGQRAEIRVDTFPGIVINAIVDSIAPASGAQFACCLRTTRPAISPRSFNGSRSNCGSAPTIRWPVNCGRGCRSSRQS